MQTFIDFLNTLLGFVPAVAAGAVLIAVIVDGIKRVGWLPDGYAPLAASILNVLLWVGAYFSGTAHADQFQSVVSGLTLIAPVIVGALVTAISAAKAHTALTKVGVGFSHTASLGGVG